MALVRFPNGTPLVTLPELQSLQPTRAVLVGEATWTTRYDGAGNVVGECGVFRKTKKPRERRARPFDWFTK